MMRPTITVIMYIPSCRATTSKSAMEMIFPQMRQAIPTGEYLKTDGTNHIGVVTVVTRCAKTLGRPHLPHDRTDKLHDNLVQDVEKLQHQFGLFPHFTHNDSKSNKEANQTCKTQYDIHHEMAFVICAIDEFYYNIILYIF